MAIVLLATGCAETVRNLEGAGIKIQLEGYTEAVLLAEGITLDGALLCAADVSDDWVVSGSCNGNEADGTEIRTLLDGTLAEDFSSCSATLAVTRGDALLQEETNLDCTEQFGGVD